MEFSAEAVVSAEPGAAVVSAEPGAAVVSAVDSLRRQIPGELNRCSPTAEKQWIRIITW